MAGCHDANVWKQPPDEGSHEPKVMAVHDVRLECCCKGANYVRELLLVRIEIQLGEIEKSRAFVGHYVAHPDNWKPRMASWEADKPALVRRDAVEIRYGVRFQGSDQAIIVSTTDGFSEHRLQVAPAPRGIWSLANDMQDFQ